jgi:hypothetical protein
VLPWLVIHNTSIGLVARLLETATQKVFSSHLHGSSTTNLFAAARKVIKLDEDSLQVGRVGRTKRMRLLGVTIR